MRRRHRLRHSGDIDQLWRQGKRWHHPKILLVANPNDLQINRYGFSASHHFGTAVERNKVKRVLRELVRMRLDEIESGWDCLFVARRSACGAAFSEMEKAVVQLLTRSGLLISKSNTSM